MVEEMLSGLDYFKLDMQHEIPDIDFNRNMQHEMLQDIMAYYDKIFQWKTVEDEEISEYRYRRGNDSISDGDAVGLFCMLNTMKPKRLIEVGSGHSSAISLDVNEYFCSTIQNLKYYISKIKVLEGKTVSKFNTTK